MEGEEETRGSWWGEKPRETGAGRGGWRLGFSPWVGGFLFDAVKRINGPDLVWTQSDGPEAQIAEERPGYCKDVIFRFAK